MSWAKLDDLYDDHPKLLAAVHVSPLAAAMHAHAITATARRETDGLVDPFWLVARVPDDRERGQVLSVLCELRLFDLLPAGETRELVDGQGYTVTLGPWAEERYLVHDYLDFNPSSTQLRERRIRDLRRKRGTHADSVWNPSGIQVESERIPDGVQSDSYARARPRPDPTPPQNQTPPRGRARGSARRRNPGTEEMQDPPASPQQKAAERDRLAEQSAFCAHFPNTPQAIVLNVRRRIIAAGHDPTIANVRSELEDPQL